MWQLGNPRDLAVSALEQTQNVLTGAGLNARFLVPPSYWPTWRRLVPGLLHGQGMAEMAFHLGHISPLV